MTYKTENVTPVLLERYLCNEVTSEEREFIERACATDAKLKKKLDSLQVSNSELMAEYPSAEMVPAIERKAHMQEVQEREKGHKGHIPLVAMVFKEARLGMAVVLIVALIPVIYLYVNTATRLHETTRVKGHRPYLTIYRQVGDSFEKLHDGTNVATRDRIQIGYVAGDKKYGLIFSVDGNGTVTIHYPENASAKTGDKQLEPNGEHLLATSFELDNAPLFERFFFVTSDEPIAIEKVVADFKVQLAKQGADNPDIPQVSPDGYEQMAITLLKEKKR